MARDIPVNEFDEWVRHVADPTRNPNPPDDVIALIGFLSDADQYDPGNAAAYNDETTRTRYRLYLSVQLDDYLVIKKADILHSVRIPNSWFSPLGGNMVWVKRDAVIEHVRVSHYEAQANFLQGPVAGFGSAAQPNLAAQFQGSGGVTLACPGGGVTLACPGGGVTLACPGGGVTLACPGGGVSLVMCPR
jgi:hypothetical protein